jgi:hypothetical protein
MWGEQTNEHDDQFGSISYECVIHKGFTNFHSCNYLVVCKFSITQSRSIEDVLDMH